VRLTSRPIDSPAARAAWRGAMEIARASVDQWDRTGELDLYAMAELRHALRRARAVAFPLRSGPSRETAEAFVRLTGAFADAGPTPSRDVIGQAVRAAVQCLDRLIVNEDTAAAQVWRGRMADQD